MRKARSETPAPYTVPTAPTPQPVNEDEVIAQALAILMHRMRTSEHVFSSPSAVSDYLRLKLAQLPHEVFVCIWVDAQNQLIDYEEIFRGTLTQTSVYPREVVKAALHHNAAGVIFAHNHPSSVAEPSRADKWLTRELKNALALVDVRVLDHFIVAGAAAPLSFAERGQL